MRLSFGLGLYDLIRAKLSGAPPSPLLDGLVSYWPLDELSGVRYDAVGENDLSDNNTVSAVVSGPVGTVASFVEANTESLSATSFVFPRVFTFATWINATTAPDASYDEACLVGFRTAGTLASDFFEFHILDTTFGHWVGFGGWIGDKTYNYYVQPGVYPDIGNRHILALVTFDGSNLKVRAYGTGATDDGTDLTLVGDISGTIWAGATGKIEFGMARDGSVFPFGGTKGPTALWSRVLSEPEKTAVFNSGVALKYADLTAGLKTDLVSYWNLDEVSGVRYDSHASADLTDNNTVGSVTAVAGAMHNAAASFVAGNTESLSVAAALNLSSGFTISAWVATNRLAAADFVVFSSANRAIELQVVSNTERALIHTTDGYFTKSLGQAFDTGFHLWTATFDGSNLDVGLDGVMTGSPQAVTGILDTTNTLILGYNATLSDGAGLTDEVAIWSRILTSDEITELWNMGGGKFYDFS